MDDYEFYISSWLPPKRKNEKAGGDAAQVPASECPECHKYIGHCPACHRDL